MVRNAKKKKTSTVELYRHFAVVTIAITAMVGLLADGEAHKALEEHQAEKAEKQRLAEAEALSRGNRQVIKEGEEIQGTGSFGPSTAVGTTMSGYASSTLPTGVTVERPSGENTRPYWTYFDMTEEEWKRLSNERRAELIKSLGPLRAGTEKERRQAMRKLAESSRTRSGASAFSSSADAPTDGY